MAKIALERLTAITSRFKGAFDVSKGQDHFDQPVPPNAVCARCGRTRPMLQWCSLTGTGDHPRRFILCAECIAKMIVKSRTSESPPSGTSSDMTEAEMRRETRKQRAFNRLGTDDPICACCPETDWRCMELHHLEGKDFGKTLIRVCRNCHRKLSDVQKDHPAKLGEPPSNPESIAHFLRGLADLLRLIADKLVELAESLFEQARRQASKSGRR
jgi:DNA-directed RNA polymerase subunit RPC12/RpoP